MLDFSKTFERYQALVQEVDRIFSDMQTSYPDCVRCDVRCSDCCHAVFDVTLIEAVFINGHFNRLAEADRARILERAETADRKYYQIKRGLKKMYVDQRKSEEEVFSALARERVRCPLLNEDALCDLYAYRPITCRVYGIPTAIGGKAHICEHSAFKPGAAYPTVNLDRMNDRLFELSRALLEEVESKNPKLCMSLVPPSAALMADYDEKYLGV